MSKYPSRKPQLMIVFLVAAVAVALTFPDKDTLQEYIERDGDGETSSFDAPFHNITILLGR